MKLARAYAGLRAAKAQTRSAQSFSRSSRASTAAPSAPSPPPTRRSTASHSVPSFPALNSCASTTSPICAQSSPTEVCAILVEAIQGEGGIRPLTQEFFAEARALASSTGALLIVDEIQAGMGRTGKWCAYQHYGISEASADRSSSVGRIQPDVTTSGQATLPAAFPSVQRSLH
jgi:acetylornithine/N-succinyldiaminopimelate aminotransferase